MTNQNAVVKLAREMGATYKGIGDKDHEGNAGHFLIFQWDDEETGDEFAEQVEEMNPKIKLCATWDFENKILTQRIGYLRDA